MSIFALLLYTFMVLFYSYELCRTTPPSPNSTPKAPPYYAWEYFSEAQSPFGPWRSLYSNLLCSKQREGPSEDVKRRAE